MLRRVVHQALALRGGRRPAAAHAWHAALPMPATRPRAQVSQRAVAATATGSRAISAVEALRVPAGHRSQVGWPARAWKKPAAQRLQPVEPSTDARPALHGAQDALAAAAAKRPAPHGAQVER